MNKLIKIQIAFFCFSFFTAGAQTKTEKNILGISIPVIWNSSDALVGSKINSGSAVSFGINTNYSSTIAGNFFGLVGAGFFKQTFGIRRNFSLLDYEFGPAYFTHFYNYNCVQLKLGAGYRKDLGKINSIYASADIDKLISFRQKYNQREDSKSHQLMSIGESLNFNFGIYERLAHNFSFGLDAVVPVYVSWKMDKVLDDSKIARNKLSTGIEISGKYHF